MAAIVLSGPVLRRAIQRRGEQRPLSCAVGMQVRCASLPFDKPNKVIVELSSPDGIAELLSQVSLRAPL